MRWHMTKYQTIRKATASDEDRIHAINLCAWSGGITRLELLEQRHGAIETRPWNERMADIVGEAFKRPAEIAYVAEVEDEVVGYALGHSDGGNPPRTGTISYNAVDQDFRNRGIGTALVRAVVDELMVRGVSVLEVATLDSDLPAQAIYRRLGFTEFTRIVCYSRDVSPGDEAE